MGEVKVALHQALTADPQPSKWAIKKLEIMSDHLHHFLRGSAVDWPNLIVGH